jgi:hypothetical protein
LDERSDREIDTAVRDLQRNPFQLVLNEVDKGMAEKGLPDHSVEALTRNPRPRKGQS